MSWDLVVDIASVIAIAAGAYFTVVGAIGLVRMPDVYTRMHAASLIDTLGAGLILLGLLLQAGFTLVGFKLVLLYVLLLFTTPVATHAVAQAALTAGIEPKLDHDRRNRANHATGSIPAAEQPTDTDGSASREA